MLAFIPWGYFAGKHISDWGRGVLATFLAIVFFAFSIRALVEGEWANVKICLIVAGFFTVLACGFWTGWNFKVGKAKADEPPKKQLSANEAEMVRRIGEEAFGLPKQPTKGQKQLRRTR